MVPCDLITELNPRDFFDAHRVCDPTFSALFYEPGSTESASKDDGIDDFTKRRQWNLRLDRSLTLCRYRLYSQCACLQSTQIRRRGFLYAHVFIKQVNIATSDDFFFMYKANKPSFRFPRVRVHTDLQDAHLYIFKRWVIDMLVEKENITSISKDLIPMLVKCQYQKKLVEREQIEKCKCTFSLWLVVVMKLICFLFRFFHL